MWPLIPYKRITIQTSLSEQGAAEIVSGAISPPRPWPRRRHVPAADFEGTAFAGGFRFHRAIRHRNSFLPILNGRILPNEMGTLVEIRMMPHPAVLAFCIAWVGSAFFTMLLALIISLVSGEFQVWVLAPLGMLVFFYLLLFWGFGAETDRAEQFVYDLFEDYLLM